MNYELANKLKDAGFPQRESYVTSSFTKEDAIKISKSIQSGEGVIVPFDNPFFPTLSELIEACELSCDIGGFRTLVRNFWSGWTARGGGISKKGPTPEEAVANLWLALNETRS